MSRKRGSSPIKKFFEFVTVVMGSALLCGLLVTVIDFDPFRSEKESSSEVYTIEYVGVINGKVSEIPITMFSGTCYYPSSYESGTDVEIDDLISDYTSDIYYCYSFEGWYADEYCLIPFEGITEEAMGNLTLFAKISKRSLWTKYY